MLLWCSALAAVIGAGLFTVGSGAAATLLGAGVLGLAGTTLLTVIQAILSDRHGRRRDQALTEANIGAGASAQRARGCGPVRAGRPPPAACRYGEAAGRRACREENQPGC